MGEGKRRGKGRGRGGTTGTLTCSAALVTDSWLSKSSCKK
jgi:hypothetical protein